MIWENWGIFRDCVITKNTQMAVFDVCWRNGCILTSKGTVLVLKNTTAECTGLLVIFLYMFYKNTDC